MTDKHFILFNKPVGVLCGREDVKGRPTVYDFLPEEMTLTYPVGRLDLASRGLLLMSNDRQFFNSIIHAKCKINKKYKVFVKGHVDRSVLKLLKTGIPLKEGLTLPAKVRVIDFNKKGFLLEFTLQEGRYRQIRRMCSYCQLEVKDLFRFQIGNFKLKGLPEGQYRELTPAEQQQILQQ